MIQEKSEDPATYIRNYLLLQLWVIWRKNDPFSGDEHCPGFVCILLLHVDYVAVKPGETYDIRNRFDNYYC